MDTNSRLIIRYD